MSEIVERLKKSKEQSEKKDHHRGLESGRKWAESEAEWQDLERLADAYGDQDFDGSFYGERSGADYFFSVLNPDDLMGAADGRAFWANNAGTFNPSSSLVLGFWEGAVKVFEEVSPEVE